MNPAIRHMVLDSASMERINACVKYAEDHIVSLPEILEIMNEPGRAVGNDPERVVQIAQGIRVVFSIESQPPGLCRHLSVSLEDADNPKNMVPPSAVQVLMGLFGFEGGLPQCHHVWLEDLDGDEGRQAVNVLQLVGDPEMKANLKFVGNEDGPDKTETSDS